MEEHRSWIGGPFCVPWGWRVWAVSWPPVRERRPRRLRLVSTVESSIRSGWSRRGRGRSCRSCRGRSSSWSGTRGRLGSGSSTQTMSRSPARALRCGWRRSPEETLPARSRRRSARCLASRAGSIRPLLISRRPGRRRSSRSPMMVGRVRTRCRSRRRPPASCRRRPRTPSRYRRP